MEVLFQFIDKTHPNGGVEDATMPKAGDVLALKPDGFAWTPYELSNPNWRIVSCSQVPLAEAEAYLAHAPADEILLRGRWARKRLVRLDYTKLPPQDEAKFGPPREAITTLSLTRLRQMVVDVPESTNTE